MGNNWVGGGGGGRTVVIVKKKKKEIVVSMYTKKGKPRIYTEGGGGKTFGTKYTTPPKHNQ